MDNRTTLLSILLAGLLIGPIGSVHAQNTTTDTTGRWSEAQKEVWEREKTYWKLRKAADVEGFMELWDERFVGWTSGGIIDRQKVKELVAEEFEGRSSQYDYDLVPLAVNIYGETAIAFYGVAFYGVGDPDEENTEYDGRFAHVWKKKDGEWRIIGGMSAPREPKEDEE